MANPALNGLGMRKYMDRTSIDRGVVLIHEIGPESPEAKGSYASLQPHDRATCDA